MLEFSRIVFALAALTVIGTVGYMLIEDWPTLDAVYMTVITLTTVGFTEVNQLSSGGRIFTIFLLIIGLGVFLFGVVQLGEVVVRAQLTDWFGRRRMSARLATMKDHFIVCGFGRFGRRLCQELTTRSMPFIVIEQDQAVVEACEESKWPVLVGDATEDSVLLEAGIERARGIACALPTDAANVYAVLSARLLNKEIQILSRATTEQDAEKVRRAGADRVVSLYGTAATKMAQLMANPRVEDFIEIFTTRGKAVDLAEIEVSEDADYAGQALGDTDLRRRGVMVVGIRNAQGVLRMTPGPAERIEVGDSLIAIGDVDAIGSLLKRD